MLQKVGYYLLKINGFLVLRNAFAFPPIVYTWTFIIAIQSIDQSEESILPDMQLEALL